MMTEVIRFLSPPGPIWVRSLLPASAWPSPGYCTHLGSKSADGSSLSLSLSLSFLLHFLSVYISMSQITFLNGGGLIFPLFSIVLPCVVFCCVSSTVLLDSR